MTYTLKIDPVDRNNITKVLRLIEQFGQGLSRQDLMRAVRSGGVIAESVNRDTAERLVNQLRRHGVVVEVIPDRQEPVGRYEVILVDAGETVVQLIKVIRKITGKSLREAKELIDGSGVIVSYDEEEEALNSKELLESAGAEVRVRDNEADDEPEDDEPSGDEDREPVVRPEPGEHEFLVYGQILWEDGEPAAGVRVRAYDKDLRSDDLLGEDQAGSRGEYVIPYRKVDFKSAEMGGADLMIRAFTENGQRLNVKVKNRELTTIGNEAVLFNAGREEELTVEVNREEVREQSRYRKLIRMLEPIMDGAEFQQLTREDIKFLHHESELPVHELSLLAEDHRYSERTGMPRGVYFGLAMKEIGLSYSNGEEFPQIDLSIVADTKVEKLMRILKSAIEVNLIPRQLNDSLGEIERRFRQLAERFGQRSRQVRQQQVMQMSTLSGLESDSSRRLAELMIDPDPTGDISDSADPIETLQKEGAIDEQQAGKLRVCMDLDRMSRIGLNLAETVFKDSLPGIQSVTSLRDLAALDRQAWKNIIAESGAGDSDSEETDQLAADLSYEIEARYPTPALEHRIVKKDYNKPLETFKRLESLFTENNQVFKKIGDGTVDVEHMDLGEISGEDAKKVMKDLSELAPVTRTFSRLGVGSILDDRDLSTDEKLGEIDRRVKAAGQFLEANRELDLKKVDLIGLDENRRNKANYEGIEEDLKPLVRKQMMAFQRVLNLAPDMDAAERLMSCGYESASRIQASAPSELARKANLEIQTATTIYQRANSIALEARRIAHHVAVEHQDVRIEPGFMTLSSGVDTQLRKIDGYEDLFGAQNYCSCRHCASIFGPVAYFVDLMKFVNKHVLSPQFGEPDNDDLQKLDLRARRPDLWSMELDCDSATSLIPTLTVVNEILEHYLAGLIEDSGDGPAVTAYQELSEARHSFRLPFHRPLSELRIYLQHMGLNLSDLVGQVHGDGEDAAREYLSLSIEEMERIVEPTSSESELAQLYDADEDDLQELSVPMLEKASGLKRSEVTRLLKLPLIRETSSVQVERIAAGETPNRFREVVVNLTPETLDRIHRFIRLFRVLPWTLEETDYLIRKHGYALFDESSDQEDRMEAVIRLSRLARLQQQLGVSAESLQATVGNIPTETLTDGQSSLFDRLFNPEQLAPDLSDEWTPGQVYTFKHDLFGVEEEPLELDENYYRLLSASRLGEDDFETLLSYQLMEESDRSEFDLDESDLSTLIAYSLLVRSLEISPTELFMLIELTNDTGSNSEDGFESVSELVETLNWIGGAGLSVEQVYVMVNGIETDWPDERIADLLDQALAASQEVSFSDNLFTDLEPLDADEVDLLVSVLLDRGQIEKVDQENDQEEVRYRVADEFEPDSELNLTFEDEDLNDQHEVKINHLEEYEELIRTRLTDRLPEEAGVRQIASAFDLSLSQFNALSEFTSLDRSKRTHWIDLLEDVQDEDTPGPTSVNFIRDMERTLHWVAPLDLEASQVLFISENTGLFDIEKGEILSLKTVRLLTAYRRLHRKASDKELLHQILKSGASDSDSLAELYETSPSYIQSFLDNISLAGGAEESDIDTLDRLGKLDRCIRLARRIGVNGATLSRMAASSYDTLETAREAVLAAFKASYEDEEEFENELRSSRDAIREERRDALVDYILMHPKLSFDTTRDLYSHLIIDTEVAGCNDTSRIVQATKSLQLYVHRCLMGLETTDPEANDPVRVNPPSEMRQEWEWRKNYRVWEANRKVFVYPENYLNPDLRDNKTPLFKSLEKNLLQHEITSEQVEKAYKEYLEGLQDLAGLTIHSACYHEEEEAYYFIGRTCRDDSRFFLRKMSYIGDAAGWQSIVYDSSRPAEWEAWEEIDLKIQSPVVTPSFYRGRLYLFWIEAQPEQQAEINNGSSVDGGTIYKIVLHVAYRNQDGSWSEAQELELFKDENFGQTQIDRPRKPHISEFTITINIGPTTNTVYDQDAYQQALEEYQEEIKKFNEDPENRRFRDRLEKTWYKVYPFVHDQELYLDYRNSDSELSKQNSDWSPNTFHLDLFNSKATRISSRNDLENEQSSLYIHMDDYVGSYGKGYNLVAYVRDYLNDFDVEHALHAEYKGSGNKIDLTEFSEDFSIGNEFVSFNDQTNLLTVHGAPGSFLLQLNDKLYFLEQNVDAFLIFPIPKWRVWPVTTGIIGELGHTLLSRGMDGLLTPDTSEGIEDEPFPLPISNPDIFQLKESFDAGGPYAIYFRELFLHLPLLIAQQLNASRNYEAAQKWYHYVFDPTTDDEPPTDSQIDDGVSPAAHYWKYPEFRKSQLYSAEDMMGDDQAIAQYRKNPFSPHAIARIRTRAYQKAVVMDYVNNLLDWADELFARDSRESINEATMLYAMAADILGPRPRELGECETIETLDGTVSYMDLEVEGEFDINVENLLAAGEAKSNGQAADNSSAAAYMQISLHAAGYRGGNSTREFVAGGSRFRQTLLTKPGRKAPKNDAHQASAADSMPVTQDAFCLPVNETLLGLWDHVEDRLFKIRNCMNIDGETRSLALFEPPIDPMMMVKARAGGLSLRDALQMGAEGPPLYRFEVLLERAKSYAATVQSFGSSLLSALEKKDAEELRQLQLTHKQNILNLTTDMKERQIEMEKENLEALKASRSLVEFRKTHYEELIEEGLSSYETGELAAMALSLKFEMLSNKFNTMGSIAHAVPNAGAPTSMNYGGREIGAVLTSLGGSFANMAKMSQFGASLGSRLGSYDRREEGWEFQKDVARKELDQLDRKILAGELRIALAERQLKIHETSIEQAEELYDFYEDKFTSLGLYTWLTSELNRMYRSAYNMAHEVALMAQRAWQYEKDDTTLFIEPDHWDSGKAGLLAGQKLQLQIRRMEKAHLENNRRNFEVDQTFALSQINPLALQQLREKGTCQFSIPEIFFDLAYPGQYNRRIRSVRLTIPCVAGPYVNVNAKLTLLQSRVRKEPKMDKDDKSYLVADHRSRNQSIATSRGKNDGGVFDLDFRNSRYLPFEGAGAVSEWRLELPETFRSFDYQSIADAMLHISYTAKDDGLYRKDVENHLHEALNELAGESGIQRVIHVGEEFSTQYRHLFREFDNLDSEQVSVKIKLGYRHFPYFLNGQPLEIRQVGVAFKLKPEYANFFGNQQVTSDPVSFTLSSDTDGLDLSVEGELGKRSEPAAFSRHPFGSITLNGESFPILRDGTLITLGLNRSELKQLATDLTQEAGIEFGDDGITGEHLIDLIEDLCLVVDVKVVQKGTTA